MAARRSQAQLDELAAFVRRLYEKSDAATWKEFADRAGVHWASLSNWQRAKGGVDGWNLYLLIRAADGLPANGAQGPAHLEEALRELPAQVAAEISRSDSAKGLDEREQRVADQLRAQSELLVQLAAAAAEMRQAARDLQEASRLAERRPA